MHIKQPQKRENYGNSMSWNEHRMRLILIFKTIINFLYSTFSAIVLICVIDLFYYVLESLKYNRQCFKF